MAGITNRIVNIRRDHTNRMDYNSGIADQRKPITEETINSGTGNYSKQENAQSIYRMA
jgi:hypothetical protein